MAKESVKARQRKREALSAKFAEKRAALKAAGDYKAILASEMSRDAQFSNALASFARGLAGGAGNYNPNIQPNYSLG